ncbi:Membrane protein involved in the export of O-antigen and teichoic acid [Tangfeifania diversioriginum]|uniref:Membrane protein involved in the export of O-antigen and teichoic acid n=1 Tax=Tangfeifania diversioriginum TaxID=1168035 RepID=A0A1M6LRZ9_9BACT|nr:oligosaccharide flippase family protein [Tangfeifania diversioriginum]SHJ73905.1 Membrane protein involved in the export of O-antigen and teichoic acid [Tangfeifania diversioriginum]
MGIIIKQSIKGSIWSYLGVGVGFVTTAYLFPNYLTPEVVGLFGLLVSWSTLMGRLSLLGLPGVTNRLFSYFRDSENGHNGFLRIALLFHIVGLILFLSAFVLLKPHLVETNIEDSPLFVEYLYLLVPLTIATMVFTFLDAFNKMLYDAVFGTFLQEFFQRVLVFGVTLLFVFKLISLEQLIISYAVAISLKALIITFFLLRKKEIKMKPPTRRVGKSMQKEIVNVALFSLITGLGSMIVFNIDKIIINQMLDLTNTGVYTIAFYFGSLVVMPSRTLLRISGALIADAWRKDDIKTIEEIYYKSCLNQLIIGGFLFLGIWANIDNILIILGDDYSGAKWVIFFIGLGYLFDMSTGSNGQIIAFSKYYRVNLVFISLLIALVITLMYLLIPIWGISGAAVAIASSLMLNNLMRYIFLFWKYKMQPFNWKFSAIIGFNVLVYFVLQLIPEFPLIIDLFVRGGLIVLLTLVFILFFPVSEDITKILNSLKKLVDKN